MLQLAPKILRSYLVFCIDISNLFINKKEKKNAKMDPFPLLIDLICVTLRTSIITDLLKLIIIN